MKTYLECIPCFINQALKTVQFVTGDEDIQEKVLRAALAEAEKLDFSNSPPAMGRVIHRLVCEMTGDDDPYKEAKERSNRLALDLYPRLQAKISASDNPFDSAVRVAIAGNIIDFAKIIRLDDAYIRQVLYDSFHADLPPSAVSEFRAALDEAEDILFLGDNAGEIVFDRLLLEQMPREKVTYVVRGSPIINDATREDARMAGITSQVEVIDNGSDVPGTILGSCSPEFRNRFEQADLIVAKGQGNYETLNEAGQNIFFLFKVKCPVVAADTGSSVGDLQLLKKFARIGQK